MTRRQPTSLYAAYGSNLHPQRLRERIRSATLRGTGFLRRYTLQFHKRGQDDSAKCGISACGQGLHVAVYEVNGADRRVLDGIEGVGKGYEVDEVCVPGFGRCFTYVASRTHIDDLLQPFDWYRDMVLLGCLRHGFPAPYCERIAALPVIEDPDPARREQNRGTVERLQRS
ncbi:MAG TPA: gamma-glutamylcyclotransferase family protein [Woeseiaceae bacterium]|nr:gamma-glutamylcyclotransferase family protein [Woeseiaceae bacterium]